MTNRTVPVGDTDRAIDITSVDVAPLHTTHRRRRIVWHYLLYIGVAIAVVQGFALAQHLFMLGIPLEELPARLLIIPAIVGGIFGYLLGLIRLLLTNEQAYNTTIRQRERRLAQEITTRQQLAGREERLTAALAGANDGIWDWDLVTGETYCSPRLLEMVGYTDPATTLKLDYWREMLHPDDQDEVIAAMNNHLKGATPQFTMEYRSRHRNGHWLWLLGRGKVIARDENGRALRIVGTMTDIGARKRVELALRSLVEATATTIGEDFFQNLVRRLAPAMGVRYAMVGELTGSDDRSIRTLAFWDNGALAAPVEYNLTGTPCDVAVGFGLCIVKSGLRERFPNDTMLAELGVESYIGIPVRETGGKVLGLLAVMHDKPLDDDNEAIARSLMSILAARTAAELQRQHAERALSTEKERALVTLDSIADAVITADAEGRVQYMNPVAEQLTGWRDTDAVGRPMADVFKIIDENTGMALTNPALKCLENLQRVTAEEAALLVGRDGKRSIIEESAAPIFGQQGDIIGVVTVFRDVGPTREMARQMSWQATHDSLTGLVNRQEFEHQLERLIAGTKDRDQQHTLLYLDLDQFKIVNDTCGHSAGDELLRQLAFLLQEQIRHTDLLARLGGDEFGILLENCGSGEARDVAQKIVEAFNDFRFMWGNKTFDIGVSIGVVVIDKRYDKLASVLTAADLSCYAAKDIGRNRIHLYEPGDAHLMQRHGEMQWASRITHALQNDMFQLYVQRIIDLNGQGDDHFEVIVRMIDDHGMVVSPNIFIPAAERYDLMPNIDRWIISKTFGHIRTHSGDEINYSINISGKSISDERFLPFIRESLKSFAVDPKRICFEITETAAISNLAKATDFIRQLNRDGCRFALDDFGSGLSSFAYLKNLPVDFLKIDGSFVADMVHDPIDYSMVKAINDIGHTMGLKTIAEFVENHATLEALRHIGVDCVQGYGIDIPRPLVPRDIAGGEAISRAPA